MKTRIALPHVEGRRLLKEWCCKKLPRSGLKILIGILTSFEPIYTVFLWVLEAFPVLVPEGIIRFLNCLSQPTAVCSYIPPTQENFDLLEMVFKDNFKSDVTSMRKLSESLPIFYNVLCSLFEAALPRLWKPLLRYLVKKSLDPFNNTKVQQDLPPPENDLLSFFPSLPLRRGRGKYSLDNPGVDTSSPVCNKYYRGHPKLTPGIFTIYCPHGIFTTYEYI